MSKPMREVQLGEPGTVDAVIETLRHDVVMVQMPTVFVLLAPPNSDGVARLDRTKLRLPNKNYGTALGELSSFYAMATPGTLPPELDSVVRLQRLSGAFIRFAVAPGDYNSPMVRNGTAQGLLLEGPHRELFRAVEASFADVVEPAIVGGHRFAAPLCTSANISGHPDGSIVSWERATRVRNAAQHPAGGALRAGAGPGRLVSDLLAEARSGDDRARRPASRGARSYPAGPAVSS